MQSVAVPPPVPTIRSVQYLRALAALAVLVFHANEAAGRAFVVGPAGVDVFFVISGFIMWRMAAGRAVAPAAFLMARLVRIVPSYWLVTLLMVAVSQLVPDSFPHLAPRADHVALSLLFVPHVDPQGQVFPLLVAGWTLNYEMFFYTVFAAGLALPQRWRLAGVLGALFALVAWGLVAAPSGPVLFSLTNPLLLEFAAGIGLAVLAGRGRLPGRAMAVAAMAAGLAAFGVQGLLPGAPDAWRLLAWGVPAVLLVGGALAFECHGAVPASAMGLRLGAASYAIYLVHGLAISAVARLHPQLPAVVFVAVCVVVSVAAGLVFHVALELPMTRWLHHRLRGAGRRIPVGGIRPT